MSVERAGDDSEMELLARLDAQEQLICDLLKWIDEGMVLVMPASFEVQWTARFEPLLARAKVLGIESRKDVQS